MQKQQPDFYKWDQFKRILITGGNYDFGKTIYIKTNIIPSLKKYFVIDRYGEYKNVAPENKYVCDKIIPLLEEKANVINIVKKQDDDCVIIFDDAARLFFMNEILSLMGNKSFILCFKNLNKIRPFLKSFDLVLDNGEAIKTI